MQPGSNYNKLEWELNVSAVCKQICSNLFQVCKHHRVLYTGAQFLARFYPDN